MITEARQIQALADLVGGHKPEIKREQMSIYYGEWWDYIVSLPQASRLSEMVMAKGQSDDREEQDLIEAIITTRPGQRSSYANLDQIGENLPEISWLWPGWIPNRVMTMLAGSPGSGKTYVALDLCYRLVNGLSTPDGEQFNTRKKTVVYVDGEDFLSAIYQRSKAWQMDNKHFYPLERPERGMIDLAKPEFQDALIDMVYDLKPAAIVIDSLSTISTKGENAIEDLRDLLTFLVELSKNNDTALILLHHVKKPSAKSMDKPLSMYDLRGSGHIVAMARSIIGVDQNSHNPNGPRSLSVLKTNLGQKPKPLTVDFQSSDKDSNIANLVYGSGGMPAPEPVTKVDECANWLVEKLIEPMAYAELKSMASDEIKATETTLQRARKQLNGLIIDTLGARQPGNKWALKQTIEQ